MIILAIDPGSAQSAYVAYDTIGGEIVQSGIYENEDMLSIIKSIYNNILAIEMVASYGMPVGKTVFETCLWVGRFIESHQQMWRDTPYKKYYRKTDICMHLCHSTRAKDSNIRQAIIDRYPATGGGKTPQIGIQKKPGPLYGVSKDVWAALAVAITCAETLKDK